MCVTGVFDGEDKVSGDLKLVRQYCCSADWRVDEGAAGSLTCGGATTGAAILKGRKENENEN